MQISQSIIFSISICWKGPFVSRNAGCDTHLGSQKTNQSVLRFWVWHNTLPSSEHFWALCRRATEVTVLQLVPISAGLRARLQLLRQSRWAALRIGEGGVEDCEQICVSVSPCLQNFAKFRTVTIPFAMQASDKSKVQSTCAASHTREWIRSNCWRLKTDSLCWKICQTFLSTCAFV